MKKNKPDLRQEVFDFHRNFKSVILATATFEGDPDASYTPYLLDDSGDIFIFVSELAQHTKNLINSPKASLLWISGEEESRNLFARRRLTLQCEAIAQQSDTAQWNAVLTRMQHLHGKTIEVLRSLPDFHLFRLKARRGNYVRGFAQAFPASGDELQSWLQGSADTFPRETGIRN